MLVRAGHHAAVAEVHKVCARWRTSLVVACMHACMHSSPDNSVTSGAALHCNRSCWCAWPPTASCCCSALARSAQGSCALQTTCRCPTLLTRLHAARWPRTSWRGVAVGTPVSKWTHAADGDWCCTHALCRAWAHCYTHPLRLLPTSVLRPAGPASGPPRVVPLAPLLCACGAAGCRARDVVRRARRRAR